MIAGAWNTATVAKNGTTSGAVDLGADYKDVLVIIPALDSATVTVHISNDNSTFYPMYILDDDATGSFAHATSAITTAVQSVIFHIGAVRWVKVVCSASQTTAARTFYVRGC